MQREKKELFGESSTSTAKIYIDFNDRYMEINFHDNTDYCRGNSGSDSSEICDFLLLHHEEIIENWGHRIFLELMVLFCTRLDPATINFMSYRFYMSSSRLYILKREKYKIWPIKSIPSFANVFEEYDKDDNNDHRLPMTCK